MPLHPHARIGIGNAERTKRYPLIQLYIIANHARLADDNPRAVVDKKSLPNPRPRVNVDPRPIMRKFAHHTRQNRHPRLEQDVRHSVNRQRTKPRITQYNLGIILRRRVAHISRMQIGAQNVAHRRQLLKKRIRQPLGLLLDGQIRRLETHPAILTRLRITQRNRYQPHHVLICLAHAIAHGINHPVAVSHAIRQPRVEQTLKAMRQVGHTRFRRQRRRLHIRQICIPRIRLEHALY